MTDPEPGADPRTEQAGIPFTEKSAEQDAVNAQIADAVADTEAAVAGGAGAVADASLAQVIAQAAGLAMLNAVNAQQNAYVTANATVLTTVSRILGTRGIVVEEPGTEAKTSG